MAVTVHLGNCGGDYEHCLRPTISNSRLAVPTCDGQGLGPISLPGIGTVEALSAGIKAYLAELTSDIIISDSEAAEMHPVEDDGSMVAGA